MKLTANLTLFLCFLLQSCSGQNQTETPTSLPSPPPPTFQFGVVDQKIDQVVRTVFQDSQGTYWFGTESGAFHLVDSALEYQDGLVSESGQRVTIKDIAEDRDGAIWIAHTGGVSRIDGDNITNYYESDGLISHDAWNITVASDGSVWIGTLEGACVWDGQQFTPFPLPEGIKDTTVGVSSSKMVQQIFEDSRGTMWFCTNAGLLSYEDNHIRNFSAQMGIRTPFVNGIFEDSESRLWISSKDGLYYLEENVLTFVTKDKINIGKGIGSVAEDGDGKIWAVVNQHDLYFWDGEGLKPFEKPTDYPGPIVFQIYKDQDNRLWMVGFGGASRLEDGVFVEVTQNGPW